MPDFGTIDDLRPLVGSTAFIPTLLSYIRKSSSGNIPLDPSLFQAILLCMIAGERHLILHTPEEDVGFVAKLADWTLSSIFDLPTHKVKIKPRPAPTSRSSEIPLPRNPNVFLRSLLVQPGRNGFDHSRPGSQSRNRKQRSSHLRSTSSANGLSVRGHLSPGVGPSNIDPKPVPEPTSPPLVINSPQPRHFSHPLTEVLPSRGAPSHPEFPRALVMSGLENASTAEQLSLMQVLIKKQVVLEPVDPGLGYNDPRSRRLSFRTYDSDHLRRVDPLLPEDAIFQGTWNVPDDFILVYVCPWDMRQRPKIHKSLLDQFAMSSTILVSQQIRQALRALPFSANALSRPRLHSHSHSSPPTPAPFQTIAVPSTRTPPLPTRALPNANSTNRNSHSTPSVVPKQLLPRDFISFLQSAAQRAYVSSTLYLYLSDLFSAVRHHPKLDGTFLTAKSVNDARALARAGRIFGTDPTGGELLRDQRGIVPFEDDEQYSDSHTSFHEYDDVTRGSGSVTIKKGSSPSHLSSIKGREPTLGTLADTPPHDPVETLFVSEADIARIVPRVVTHRLCVRDGPEDELLAGAIFGAAFEPQNKSGSAPAHGWDTRSTVKDILVEILAEV